MAGRNAIHRAVSVLFVFVIGMCGSRGARGQLNIVDGVQTPTMLPGVSPASTVDISGETVSLTTGNLSRFFPVITLPQRVGAMPLTLGFTYSSNPIVLSVEPTVQIDKNNYDTCTGNPNDLPTETVTYGASSVLQNNAPFSTNIPHLKMQIQYIGDYDNTVGDGNDCDRAKSPLAGVTNFQFVDWQGAGHSFPITPHCSYEGGPCWVPFLTKSAYSDDGSSYFIDASNDSQIVVTDPSGTRYIFKALPSWNNNWNPFSVQTFTNQVVGSDPTYTDPALPYYPNQIIDRNGNTITISNNVITDTLGRTISFTEPAMSSASFQTGSFSYKETQLMGPRAAVPGSKSIKRKGFGPALKPK